MFTECTIQEGVRLITKVYKMASTSAGSGESSNSSSSSGWRPQVAQRKRNALLFGENGGEELDLEEQITMASSVTATQQQRYCRLCLSKEQQLKPLFPPSGTPDEALLHKIFTCLTIALTFEEDYDTFVCRICVQEVTKFFLYKEQCLANDSILRGRRMPSKATPYDDGQGNGPSEELLNEESEEQTEDFEPIDSDEFDIPVDEEHSNLSDNVSYFEPRQNSMAGNGLALEPWKLKPLPKQRARRDDVQDYYYGGYRYTCATSRANGKVHWRCMYKSKLKCRAAILVSPNGTITCGPHRHCHQPDKKAVSHSMDGTILDVHTGRRVTYKLITSHRSRIHPTQVVCDGYKYRYARTTQKQTTYWRCMKHNGRENCKAILSFRLDFSSCSSNGHRHNHPAQYDMRRPLPDLLTADESQYSSEQLDLDNGTEDGGETASRLDVRKKSAKRNVMIHKGYEYGFPRTDRHYSKWACFKKSLFNCPANVYTNFAGKVIREGEWMHNHEPNDDYSKDTVLDGYMTDAKTQEQVYYKLIPGKRGQRFVLYKGYRHSSDRFMSDGRIAWKCTKCKVFIIIAGRFESFEDRGGEHEHPGKDEDDEQLDMGSCLQDLPMDTTEEEQTFGDGEVEFGVKRELIADDSDEGDEEDGAVNEDPDEFPSDEEQLIIP